MSEEQEFEGAASVLIYSDDRTVRNDVRLALGRRVAADLPEIDIVECATHQAVMKELDAGGIDVLVLDGEAVPLGGMGLTRQIKGEIADPPPIVLLIARVADAWLATWSEAEVVSSYPIDPQVLPQKVAELLRSRLSQQAVL